jgi:uncharacterized protein YjbI with pentapeptide repeats
MYERMRRRRPKPWPEHARSLSPRLLFFHRVEWYLSWVAWALGNWALLEVLDHLGSFSILFAVVLYFADSGNRLKQKHYQAWQVINTAQGRGGSGGRIEALQELNADHVSLVGVDASGAFLQGIALPRANLARCDLHASDLRQSAFVQASFSFCNLRDANFRNADLARSSFDNADLSGADLHSATLRGANLAAADLEGADLRDADFAEAKWDGIGNLQLANVWGLRHAPPAFLAFALAHGAVSLASDAQWSELQARGDK